MTAPAGRLLTGALAAALAAGACSDDSPGECQRDADCAMGKLCVARSCVTRLTTAMAWSVEVAPPAQSRHALREHPGFPFTAEPATLVTDRKVSLLTSLHRSESDVELGPASVRVAFSVPSSIPGRGELQFEVDSTSAGSMFPYETQLSLPQHLLGQAARMFVGPLAPVNRSMCPWQLDLVLGSRPALDLPGKDDTLVIEGTLLAGGTAAALPEYEARVVLDGRLASNLARTEPSGRFVLRVQRSAAMRAPGALRVELAPADASVAGVSLVVAIAAAQTDVKLPELRLPAHPAPVSVVVPVVDERQRPVAGATVNLQTALPGATGGDARFVRSAQTGSDGRATVRLIPGVAGRPAEYMVRVVPPGNAEAAAACTPLYPVGEPAGSAALEGRVIVLPTRVVLEGRFLRADGKPASGLRVRASRRGDLFNAVCAGELASAPSETASDGSGKYRLLLDPGEYRMEYEPPRDSPLPLASEENVSVPASMTRDFTLPPAVVVEGQVLAADDGSPVERVELRAFAPDKEGRTRLYGATTAGSDGRFRLVLPER